MTDPRPNLDELQADALTELLNLGVSRAALSLSTMVGEEVLLTVPAISTVTPEEAAEMIGGSRAGPLVAVEQLFTGDFAGRALLIFPEANSMEIVRAVTAGTVPPGAAAELAAEALCETGNILLQACLGTIANMLQRTIGVEVPTLVRGPAQELFQGSPEGVVVFIYISFAVRGRSVRGYFALLLNLPTLSTLKHLLEEFIAREMG